MSSLEVMPKIDIDCTPHRKVKVELDPSPTRPPIQSPKEDQSPPQDSNNRREVVLKSNPEPIRFESSVVEINRNRSRLDVSRDLTNLDRQRGKRMFGFLQGTLNAAKKENEALNKSEVGIRRREIQERIEEREREEKERLKKERIENFKNRREIQTQSIINARRDSMQAEFDRWKSNTLKMIGHIITTTSPEIFYLPAKANGESKRRLEQTENTLLDKIYHREQKLKIDIEDMKKRMTERLSRNIQNREKKKTDDESSSDSGSDAEAGDLKSSIAFPRKAKRARRHGSAGSSHSSSSSSGSSSDSRSRSRSSSKSDDGKLASTVTKV